MADTGLLTPVSAVNSGGLGTNWTNTDNATAYDSFVASCAIAAGGNSKYLLSTDYPVDLPAGATITGVAVRLAGSLTGNGYYKVFLTKNAGTGYGSEKVVVAGDFSSGLADVGGDGEMWGLSLSEAEAESTDFGTGVVAQTDSSQSTMSGTIDVVWVKVFYTTGVTYQKAGAAIA